MEPPGVGRRACGPVCAPWLSLSGVGLGRISLLSWAPPSIGGDAASLMSSVSQFSLSVVSDRKEPKGMGVGELEGSEKITPDTLVR